MKKILTTAIVLFLNANAGFAAFSNADIGTTSGSFLELGAGARPAAMGGCYAAVADDSTAIYWNPAGLAQIDTENGSLSLMNATWFDGITYDWASYARPISDLGMFGIGAQYLSYGSIKQTDDNGLNTGSFTPTDMAVSLSYAKDLNGLKLGLNLKYISSTIIYTATAYAADFGVMKSFMNDRLSIGAVAQNMGTSLQYINEKESLPFNVKFGGAYSIKSNWLILLDANAPVDAPVYCGVGTEYVQKLSGKMEIAGRAGYNTENTNTGGVNGLTAGLGIKFLDCSIDYAFVPYGDLGDTNLISLSVSFR